jgi:hypothetical protein
MYVEAHVVWRRNDICNYVAHVLEPLTAALQTVPAFRTAP